MAEQEKVREMKYKSYQSKVCKRVLELLMAYEDNDGVKIFEIFKGKVTYNAKKSIPESKYPNLAIYCQNVTRDPFAIKRQDLWNINVKVVIYTMDASENDMDDIYKWAEGIDRVCRVNPRLHLEGSEDLSINKADLEDASYEFAFGDNFIISEMEANMKVQTKLCLANQIS